LTESRKTVLITGCSSGIGRAAAFHFARQGWNVVATVRKQYQAHVLMPELHQISLHTAVELCDVSHDEALQQVVAHTIERFGRVDVLINNAGFGQSGAIELVTADEARRQLEVNTMAPARLAQLVIPHMRAQRSGRIINISSVAGRVVLPWNGWYSASKFALEALADAMRIELAPFGIKVVSVLAGPVDTQFVTNVHMSAPLADAPELYHKIHAFAQERRTRARPNAWSSERVAELLFRIATVSHPRTRYVTGGTARAAMILRKLLPDSLWDRFILRAYGASSLLSNRNA